MILARSGQIWGDLGRSGYWGRVGGGLEVDWRRIGGGLEDWGSVGGGLEGGSGWIWVDLGGSGVGFDRFSIDFR